AVPAGGARPVRLPHHLLLAGARARSLQLRARLDGKMRVRSERLAKNRSHLPMTRQKRRNHEPAPNRAQGFRALLAGAVSLLAGVVPVQAQSGGNATIYVGTYAKKILVLNESNLKVVDSIPVSVGIPTSMVLSFNRKHFYVLDPQFE